MCLYIKISILIFGMKRVFEKKLVLGKVKIFEVKNVKDYEIG